MDQDNRIYFNQNLIFHKDILYNSGASLEINICSNTMDYKTFSPPTIHISVIGENNLRRLCSLNYSNAVDLYTSVKDIISNIDSIYSTGRSNSLVKKYQYDKSLKFEFIQLQNNGDRVVSISVLHSSSDFAKVIVQYSVFLSFAIGILKYFVNDFVNLSFNFTNRNLLTEILEQSKQTTSLIRSLPVSLVDIQNYPLGIRDNAISNTKGLETTSNKIEETIEDFDKFLGKDMENIKIKDLEDKSLFDEKPKNQEIKSLLIPKTLTKDLSVLETMLNASITRPDPLICLLEGFRRSMNLDDNFSFLPQIPKNDLKSALYISKLSHDYYINSYLNKNITIPSGFSILKYTPPNDKIDSIHLQLAYDLLLIFGFVKCFRSRMESRESDANVNGSIFYLRLRLFLDLLVYSFLDETKSNLILNNIKTFFTIYDELGFFDHYQKILEDNNFQKININDISSFCNELDTKMFSKGILKINISSKHDDLYEANFVRIKSDNSLKTEQIINELIPLEVLEKNGMSLEDLQKFSESFSEEVKDVFFKPKVDEKKKKESETNIVKTVKFFNNEIPKNESEVVLKYLKEIELNPVDFLYLKTDELGENIIKAFYVWNESENRKEPLTEFRSRLENCLLTKDLIITKYKSKADEPSKNEDWTSGSMFD